MSPGTRTFCHLPKRSSNPSFDTKVRKISSLFSMVTKIWTYPSEANSIVFLVAFSWISIALDQRLALSVWLYSCRVGIDRTSTFSSKDSRFRFFLTLFFALSSSLFISDNDKSEFLRKLSCGGSIFLDKPTSCSGTLKSIDGSDLDSKSAVPKLVISLVSRLESSYG